MHIGYHSFFLWILTRNVLHFDRSLGILILLFMGRNDTVKLMKQTEQIPVFNREVTMKKHIVCIGDSNTHGYCADPNDCADGGIRFNENERWTCLAFPAGPPCSRTTCTKIWTCFPISGDC